MAAVAAVYDKGESKLYHRRYRCKRCSKVPIFVVILITAIVMCGASLCKTEPDSEPEAVMTTPDTYFDEPLFVSTEEVFLNSVEEPKGIEDVVLFPEEPNEPEFRYYDHIDFEYEMQELLWQACEEMGCPYELALAVIFRESSYRNVNGDNGSSIGYMQIQPRWNQARMERLGVSDLSDPLSNFRVGCDLLSELIEKYGSYASALTCYNTGKPGTSKYADRVLSYMDETFSEMEVKQCPEE